MISYLKRLIFGERQPKAPPRDVAALIAHLMVPAIQIVKTDEPSLSHFGGKPNLPNGAQWPDRDGKPLDFLARLSLTELHKTCPIDWLPSTGALLFFYDMKDQPWGYDPRSRGAIAILQVPDLVHKVRPGDFGSGLPFSPLAHRSIVFERIKVAPEWDHPAIHALKLSEDEFELLSEIKESEFGAKPRHQIGGFASPVQNNSMELECQLVTNGLYCGDASGYNDPRAASLAAGSENWKLLFQLDSDDDLEIMWGDAGRIYFWIEEQRAAVSDFSNAWLILQCS